ncbi:histidine kinase [Spongiactinospora rosea]|uniref:Signal transduction histidine-protein kinase/phosphatase MprB n=1 Tax=Spongiactinospora rosea TaxID=2248750 RepID=A0A366LXC7_9ACTN|nr:DUF4153 domain-containing protein [Spongiactinospora rosea]RBQ18427.1 histidine kinase [Spongiactinospora rosea]
MRPLDFLGRIKIKLGVVILLAVAAAFVVNEVGINLGYTRDARIAVAAGLALVLVQLMARGMTKPLRDMAAAAQTIAKGRYGERVRATSRDEVGELASAFNAMAADLGEVDRQRRELIANVSHELRTPITALRAVLENVVDGVSEPDPETLGTALAQTERLGKLVGQLLDLSRLDSGVRLIDPEPVGLGPLIEQAGKEATLARDGVRVRGDVPPGLAVRADPGLLAQVLANLLDNAVRHSPPGGTVTVTARPDGPRVRLTVCDEGPGIPEHARAQVFERFSRLDLARAADAGGSGLGLAIVKEIVELHGGGVRIDEGPGCRMVVELPERTTVPTTPSPEPIPAPSLEPVLPEPPAPAVESPVDQVTEPVPEPAPAASDPEPPAAPPAGPPPAPTLPPASSYPRNWGLAVAFCLLGSFCGLGAGLLIGFPVVKLNVLAGLCLGALGPVAGAFVGTVIGATRVAQPAPPPLLLGSPPPRNPPVYTPPPVFPRPVVPGMPPWGLAAIVAVAVFAIVAVPYGSPGLGLVLASLAAGAAVFPAVRHRLDGWSITFGLIGYALIGTALFLHAVWVVVPSLLAGFCLVSLAISGAGRGWYGLLRGLVSLILALPPLPWFAGGPLRALIRRRPSRPGQLVAGIGLTLGLLGIFGALFASADAVFSSYLGMLLTPPGWLESVPAKALTFLTFGVLAAAGLLVGLRPVAEPVTPDVRLKVSRSVWALPLVALNLLFAAFVLVQITVLFGGGRRVAVTAGLTYAAYARQGFFQLLIVSVFVLAVVAVVAGTVSVRGRERWALAVLLGVLCLLTMVILASAMHRLGLYTDAYGYTRLRATVAATIVWLAAVFVLVVVTGAVRLARRGRGGPLPRALVALTGAGLVAFAVWNPDHQVAATQIEVRQTIGRLDVDYLNELGPEAVPALDRLPEPMRTCVLQDIAKAAGLYDPATWQSWNLARQRAREVIVARPLLPQAGCAGLPYRSGEAG